MLIKYFALTFSYTPSSRKFEAFRKSIHFDWGWYHVGRKREVVRSLQVKKKRILGLNEAVNPTIYFRSVSRYEIPVFYFGDKFLCKNRIDLNLLQRKLEEWEEENLKSWESMMISKKIIKKTYFYMSILYSVFQLRNAEGCTSAWVYGCTFFVLSHYHNNLRFREKLVKTRLLTACRTTVQKIRTCGRFWIKKSAFNKNISAGAKKKVSQAEISHLNCIIWVNNFFFPCFTS